MITLYARREASAPNVLPRQFDDVVIYRDREATDRKARYPWHVKRPDRRNRYVTLNCFRYRLEWLEDAPCPSH